MIPEDPGQGIEGGLDIGAGELGTLGEGGDFEGPLQEEIEGAGNAGGTLEE